MSTVAFGKRRRGGIDDGPDQGSIGATPQPSAPVVHDGSALDLTRLAPPVPNDMAAPIPSLGVSIDTSLGHSASEYNEDVVVGAGDGSQARPGWYPDPAGEKSYRWWDGTGWTTHVD